MEKEIILHSYVQQIYDHRLLTLAQECASFYNAAKNIFWNTLNGTGKWLDAFKIQAALSGKLNRTNIGGHGYIANIQQFYEAVKSWQAAKKEYSVHPDKFTSEPKPPTEDKIIAPIHFKEECIRYKNGYLFLSLARGVKPICFKWNKKLPKPIFARIAWKKSRGWFVSLVLEKIVEPVQLNPDKIISCDLGCKRINTIFDGQNVVTFNGKLIKSLIRLRNKNDSNTQKKLSCVKKGSRRYQKIKKAQRKVSIRIEHKMKDILHKYSRATVNYCIKNKISKCVFGDCAGIHNETNLGKENNQQVQQNPEQRLRKYIEYKFIEIGGSVESISEIYTSQTCIQCGCLNKCKNRDYVCSSCGFRYDRDGVGAVNIYLKVSSGEKLDVVGCLAQPIGYKYKSNQDCLIILKND